ncbi:hypothetical protein V9T40_013842 [Parthenolecanium corni]|uniref:Eukaryotic translation initiation factor 3 subunit B n=1 Tax=Parthenolecanium corni TaxID=536013 RepID=A0AAN9TFK6_9HEMI
MAKKKDSERHNAENGNAKNGDEPNFNDPDGFVDDISDEELLGDILATKPKETDGFDSVIIVDGIPKVGTDRLEKLKNVINKIFAKYGTIVSDYYPKDDTGSTKGYIFIEYNNSVAAREAVANANSYKLDKHHTFLVNLFTDYEKYTTIPDKWETPTPQEYPEKPNLQEYLLEPDAYDQYLVFDTDWHVQIWLNSSPHPTLLEDRERWTESFVRWSPLGTYLATVHKLGVVLWGGSKFAKVMRFAQQNVQFIDFSPCEQYLIIFSNYHDSSETKKLGIFDIRTGMEKRSFAIDGAPAWPIFRWSKDDKYFARIGQNLLSVYETPSFGLLDKKSIQVSGIRDFMWSPSDNVLAYWVAEDKDVPARVVLLEIPSRQEIRANNLFNVADCKIHWQKNGDYLCVKVDRYAKSKKEKGEVKYSGMHYNFEIFHMREKNIPVDIIEIKEPIHAFAWEPVGSKFAVIHGEASNIKVAFYDIKSGQKLALTKLLEKKVCSHLFWSPNGQYIVLAECREVGALEFIDTNDFSTMASGEHYKATTVEWDPTGRFVASSVSAWNHKMDTGYWLWSFQGKVLRRCNSNTFCEFKWRPRPQTLLSENKLKEVKKSLKKYTVQFEQKDRIRLTKASKDVVEKRQKLMKDFKEYRDKRIQEWKKQKQERLQLRSNVDTDELNADSKSYEEEIVEFIIKEEITLV